MAAFSYSHSSFLLDSSVMFLPNNTPIQVPEFSEEPNNVSTSTCTAQFYDDEDESLTKKQSSDSSSVVVDQNPQIGNQFTKRMTSTDKKKKSKDGSPSTTTAQSMRIAKKRNSKDGHQKEKKLKVSKKIQKKKVPDEVKITGVVHVRARRGEATDSHSLAERARREKISERMKLLQSLVPGCEKITGKTFVLDEIISYVQSLQTQVEILSMKLASVDPMCNDFGMDLDALAAKPQVLDSTLLSQPDFQECNSLEAMTYGDHTSINNMPSSYPLLDSLQSLQFDHHLMEMPNILHQDDIGHFLWDMDGKRQERPNHDHYGFTTNLGSFH